MTRFHQHGFQAMSLQAADKPFREWPGFKAEASESKAERCKPIRKRIGISGDVCFQNDGTVAVDDTKRSLLECDIQSGIECHDGHLLRRTLSSVAESKPNDRISKIPIVGAFSGFEGADAR